jgi:hypothetical protein
MHLQCLDQLSDLAGELWADEIEGDRRREGLGLGLGGEAKDQGGNVLNQGCNQGEGFTGIEQWARQRRWHTLAEEGVKGRCRYVECRLESSRYGGAHDDVRAFAEFAREERNVVVSAVLHQLTEFQAVKKRFDRAHKRRPFRLVAWLDGEVYLKCLLRLGYRRSEGFNEMFRERLNDEKRRSARVLGRPVV